MKLEKLKKEISKLYGDKVSVIENENSRILTGELDNYLDILYIGKLAVLKNSNKHVVNDIKLKGFKEEIKAPKIKDLSLDNKEFDFVVIGGGISGCSILRELKKWDVSVLLIEKESDIARMASSRNDGEVHPGVDLKKGSLKQSYVVKGNRMFDEVTKDLDVEFKRVGQIAGFTKWYLRPIITLYALEKRFHSHVDDTRIIGRKKIRELAPNLNPDFRFGVYNKMAGVVSPYELSIAYAENAVDNGAIVSLNTICLSMKKEGNKIVSIETNRGTIYPKVVINAGGVWSDKIAEMAGDRFYSIHPRKGTIAITDKKSGVLISTISSIKKIKKTKEEKNTKGGGVMRTIHNNLLLGPTAIETPYREDTSTSSESINNIFNKQKDTLPKIDKRDVITYFSGVRASNYEEDFIIEKGRNTFNLVHCSCIQSPGLTTAPAVAIDVAQMGIELLSSYREVKVNVNFNPIRHGIPKLNAMDDNKRDELIKENPDYGIIVCRCEEISKGEIIDALERPIKVPTVNGVKMRVRPGMGRCQGSFCMPNVAKIIAEHENISVKDVLFNSDDVTIGYYNKGEKDYE